jgi:hypothetical protein
MYVLYTAPFPSPSNLNHFRKIFLALHELLLFGTPLFRGRKHLATDKIAKEEDDKI